jgi:Ni/Co efflux regulator RcnB
MEETTMLKTISAALLAVSVLAAPALAAGTSKTTQAPAAKSAQVNEASKANKSALNANAKMGRHHVRHSGHHRVHKKMVTHKSHSSPKVAAKRFAPPAKRG